MAKKFLLLAMLMIIVSVMTMVLKLDPITSIVINIIIFVVTGISGVILYMKAVSRPEDDA